MNDAADDYGRKASMALAAVRRMHADVSRLLVDAEGTFGKDRTPAFGSYATQDLTYSYKADYWMPEGVFRVWASKPPAEQAAVDAITVRFFDLESRIEEPFLLVGQIKYRLQGDVSAVDYLTDKAGKSEKRAWHLWYAYASWGGERRPGVVLAGSRLERNVEWFKVIGVPLYSIRSFDDVTALMAQVRAAEVVPASGGGQS